MTRQGGVIELQRFTQVQLWCLRVLSVVCVVATAACGGGGGGGSSLGGDSGSDSARGVRVLHAAIDAAPVDLFSSLRSEALTSKVAFADSKGYRDLPSGTQTLTLSRALAPEARVASFDLTASEEESFSVLLYGSVSGSGLRAALVVDNPPADFSGARVRFVHGVSGASSLIVAAVGGDATYGISPGEASDYIAVTPGAVRLVARRGADGTPVVVTTETLEEGRAYTVLIAGEIGYYSKGILFRDQ